MAASSGTFFSALTTILPMAGTFCLRLLIKFVLPILPVEARLQNESVDASDEQEAFIDKLDCKSQSCLLRAEGALGLERMGGRLAVGLVSFFFFLISAAAASGLSVLFKGFEAGF